MKVLIDACVLYPTVLREIVLDLAASGAFTPLWSPRILDEWRRAAGRNGDDMTAGNEIAAVTARFPDASVSASDATCARLSLPDADDIHVLAAAIDGGADELLTLNLRDFPPRALARDAILLRHPDEFLLERFHADPDTLHDIVGTVLARAATFGIDVSDPRKILKRARLPRLGKALYA